MRFPILPALTGLLFSAVVSANDTIKSRSVPEGFVTTTDGHFSLDGKPFYFIGTNAYWLPLLLTEADVDTSFEQMNELGVKVVRTWGFSTITGPEVPDAIESGLTYFQVWNTTTEWILNDGPQGLQRLDYVVQSAKKHDIKLIITLVNNWYSYSSIDMWVEWVLGSGYSHDEFFTNNKTIASYQRWVEVVVNRYKNDSTVFAWELANEASCEGSDLPAGPSCVAGSYTIYNWYKQQSDFIRSLDPYHMITTGGSGEIYWTNSTDQHFDGSAGDYFGQELFLENIDFGVYHMYPQFWYPEYDHPGYNWTVEGWGLQWMEDHVWMAANARKPLVLEEFGVVGYENKTAIYPSWIEYGLNTSHAGIMPWQFGALGLTEDGGNRLIEYVDRILNGSSPNDGYTFYKNQTALWDMFAAAAKIQNARSG